MINETIDRNYCCEDLSLVENYEEAISSEELWDCHHRKGTDERKSRKELKELGLYYNRPASELIFLKKSEHISLHNSGSGNGMYGKKPTNIVCGKKHPMYGKHHTEESRLKISEHCKNNPLKCGSNSYQWKDICPLQLYVDRKIMKLNYTKLSKKYGCSIATICRKVKLFCI